MSVLWRFVMSRVGWSVLSFVAIATTSQLRADLIVEVQDASVNPGGESIVDVTVRSRSGVLSLSEFSIDVRIAGSIANGELLFIDSSGQMSDTDMAALSDYVFSAGVISPFSSFYNTAVDNTVPKIIANDAILGLSPPDVSIGATPLLLARLKLTHSYFSTAAESLGDTYTISVDAASADTFFKDSGGSSVAFSIGRAGLLTVTPEPSVAVLGGVAGCLAACWLNRRRATVS